MRSFCFLFCVWMYCAVSCALWWHYTVSHSPQLNFVRYLQWQPCRFQVTKALIAFRKPINEIKQESLNKIQSEKELQDLMGSILTREPFSYSCLINKKCTSHPCKQFDKSPVYQSLLVFTKSRWKSNKALAFASDSPFVLLGNCAVLVLKTWSAQDKLGKGFSILLSGWSEIMIDEMGLVS